ncbi:MULTISPECIES: hypothetical protein [unclassified Mycobacteroides]|uniref:hypothetical protein n=1 Tax=unclassified Mycobacteroides TaxID=2618759 RepID=UPI0007162478|nr:MULTISPECIES: hypothetical protein [unclassified Mycobacteroides]KRQ23332.1 hypothetical protein AOT91_23270 [Mycobacteroides sp. H092]KRQ23501.1 hypothetical protein AOT87_12530 [Mycobacteroides sp. H003]KRQ40310.1 hypothetical protein AOT92_15160 [Mycobacteroides sp. H101]KRQ47377.1 hypothetical protein AOT88_15760 [Mycobacteroides sp. H063]KRQ57758.1 hypothetical protein AOT90_25920 [Mycobacteroides sp. H079]
MIEKPESPHDLVPFWPDIDETQLASIGTQYGKLSATATQALNKSRDDSKDLNRALVEGFDTQVSGVLLVGGQHSKMTEFGSMSAEVIADAAVAFTEAKTQIVATTHAYESLISVREFEIQLLTASPMFGALGGEYKRARIDQLKREIEQLIKAARKMNDARYEGILPPVEQAAPGLTPLKNHAPAGPSDHFKVKPIDNGHRDGPKSPGDTHALDSRRSGQRDPAEKSGPSKATPESHAWDKQRNPDSAEKNSNFGAQKTPGVGNAASSGDVMGKASSLPTSLPSAPSGGSNPVSSLGSGGGLTSMMPKGGSSMPNMGSSGNMGSGLSSMGSGSAGGLNPAQQFLSGAAQGFSQSSPSTASAASAAAAQSFKPPPTSTMPSTPVTGATAPSTPAAPAGPQTVTAAPSNVGAVPPAAMAGGGVPLTAPPPAGVPANPVVPPSAAVVPPGGAGGAVGGPPPVPQPPNVMGMGAKTTAMKAFQLGQQATGEGLRATPEFSAAMALVSALNDPERPAGSLITGGWSVAVFGAGSNSVRFVAAERHGLSWIPAGVYLPAGVSIAHLDTRVPADVRHSWRGMEPSALVLAEYARAIGEQPSIVVARAYHSGLPGWFDRQVVVVADETDHVIIPNPLHEPKGRHRLEIAAPEHWQWVMSVPEEHIEAEVREVAGWLVEQHDHMFEQWPGNDEMAKLRAAALAQVGREGGSTDVAKLLAGKMGELASRLMGTPLVGTPQWTTHTYSEMQLRGWETLLLGLGASSRTVLADMQYAALMATHPVLPPLVEAVA